MGRWTLALAGTMALVLGTGCSKGEGGAKGEQAKEGGGKAQPSTTAGGASSASAAARSSTAPKIDCDQAVPQGLREKYLSGLELSGEPTPSSVGSSRVVACGFIDAENGRSVIITIGCGPAYSKTADELLAFDQKVQKGIPYEKVEGIANGGVKAPHNLELLDDDSPCLVAINGGESDEWRQQLDLAILANLGP